MLGTYASGLAEHARSDGRIHPNYKLDGARSGRTSCDSPNMQTLPRAKDSTEGKMARDCIAAPDGFTLVEFDFSQVELRVAAMLSGDIVMQQIFRDGVDVHRRTAELIAPVAWGIQPEQVEDKHRSQAKTCVFALLYGSSDASIAARLGISMAAAARLREAIFGQFKKLGAYCQDQVMRARRTGETWTYWNGQRARRRPLHRIADNDSESRSRAENGAFNSPIQGTASGYCMMSLIRAVQWIEEDCVPDVKLVLTVHDSLLFEVREEMIDEVTSVVPRIMISWPMKGLPLVVDGKVGKSWGSMEDLGTWSSTPT